MTIIERPVKKSGGSLIIVIGHHDSQALSIEEGDTIVAEIKEVRKPTKKKK